MATEREGGEVVVRRKGRVRRTEWESLLSSTSEQVGDGPAASGVESTTAQIAVSLPCGRWLQRLHITERDDD